MSPPSFFPGCRRRWPRTLAGTRSGTLMGRGREGTSVATDKKRQTESELGVEKKKKKITSARLVKLAFPPLAGHHITLKVALSVALDACCQLCWSRGGEELMRAKKRKRKTRRRVLVTASTASFDLYPTSTKKVMMKPAGFDPAALRVSNAFC